MIDEKLLSILVCPADRGPLLYVGDERLREEHSTSDERLREEHSTSDERLREEHLAAAVLYNPRLRRAYRIDDGIPVLLIDEAVDVSDEEHERLIAAAAPEDRR